MADRIAVLEAEKAALESSISISKAGKSISRQEGPLGANDPAVAQLRLDLAEAFRSKGVTEGRLRTAEEELIKLRSRSKDDSRSMKNLVAERTMLTTRLMDREHELREKRKLLEVQYHSLGSFMCATLIGFNM